MVVVGVVVLQCCVVVDVVVAKHDTSTSKSGLNMAACLSRLLRNVLCDFSTSQLPKCVWQLFYLFAHVYLLSLDSFSSDFSSLRTLSLTALITVAASVHNSEV